MPKKTRKEKKLADQRRKLFKENSIKSSQDIQIKEARHFISPSTLEPEENISIPSIEDNLLSSLILADLKKTIIISMILFTLEISIFYAMLLG